MSAPLKRGRQGKPDDLVCRLAEIREAAGLSREELAQMVETTRFQIRKLEIGDQAPGIPLALRLARVLDVAVERLWYVPSYDTLEAYRNPAPEAPRRPRGPKPRVA